MNGCGACTQKRWLYGHAEGLRRHHAAAARVPAAPSSRAVRSGRMVLEAREPDLVVGGLELQELDLPEVECDHAVHRLDLVPALVVLDSAAQLVVGLVAHAHQDHLT